MPASPVKCSHFVTFYFFDVRCLKSFPASSGRRGLGQQDLKLLGTMTDIETLEYISVHVRLAPPFSALPTLYKVALQSH